MTESPDFLYQVEDDLVIPTSLTGGPWNPEIQHGGPISGILAHLVETVETPSPMRICRHTVELMRGVPIKPLHWTTETIREGRRLQVIQTSLHDEGKEIARSTSVKLRVAEESNPVDEERMSHEEDELPPFPDTATQLTTPSIGIPAFLRAVEIRLPREASWAGTPGLMWIRLTKPLVEGVKTSPFVNMAAVSDMLSMVAQYLDPKEWVTPNVDLTVSSFKDPEGEWIGLRGVHKNSKDGIGLSDAVLYDRNGRVGRGLATILIDPRQ